MNSNEKGFKSSKAYLNEQKKKYADQDKFCCSWLLLYWIKFKEQNGFGRASLIK